MIVDEKVSDEFGEVGCGYIMLIEELVFVDGVTRFGEEVECDYVWVVELCIWSWLECCLEFDFDIFVSNMFDEYDEFVEIVCEYLLEIGCEWCGGLKFLNDEMVW